MGDYGEIAAFIYKTVLAKHGNDFRHFTLDHSILDYHT